MIKRRTLPAIILTICLLFTSVLALSFTTKTQTASADTPVSNVYQCGSQMSYQGQNNFFYAYGRKTDYMLMEYLAWDGGKVWKNPFENYASLDPWSIHPGVVLDSIVVWVADRSGTLTVDASLKRKVDAGSGAGGLQDDGNSFGVFHQKAKTVDTILDTMVYNKTGKSVSKSITVTKGDCILLVCGSGDSNNNVNDGATYTFKLTYTQSGNDFLSVETGAALSKFLKMSTPGAMSGYKHIDQDYAADDLCAEEIIDSDETTVIIRNPGNVSKDGESCSSSLTTLLPVGIMAIVAAGAFLVIKKVKRSRD